MFLKNKNIIFKIRRSKVTDYAALTIEFYKRIIVIPWSFSYNSFVKLSLYNIIHLYHDPFLWISNIADCTCHQLTNALLQSEVGRGYSLNISAHRSEITNLTCYQLTTVYMNQHYRKCLSPVSYESSKHHQVFQGSGL